ncbi:MAG: hypothetical protein LBK27_06615 [Treponema sp.]|jgi:hypothetical protein|nr:hypothetical protein [Treponema sp.]
MMIPQKFPGLRFSLFFLPAILAGLFGAAPAFSQTEPEEPVFAPFVSRLSVEVKNNLVRLSWIDSPDARGPVYIFRSAQPFETGRIPGNIRPVETPYGAQSFIDETEGAGTIHYFAAASDGLGRRYDVVIPYNNTVSVNMTGSDTENIFLTEEQNVRPAASGVFGLEVRVEEEGVNISYRTAEEGKNTVLYRSVQPLRNTADLLRAVIVQSGPPAPFVDYPVPGIPYYYAVIFEDELVRGNVGIYPGQNATTQAVEIPPGAGRIGLSGPETPIRSMPLPLLSVYNAVPGSDRYSEIPRRTPLGPEAAKALGNIPQGSPNPPPQKKPRAFSRDLEAPAGGEESPLRIIVQGVFSQRDWQSARTELLRYLSLPRSALSEARARFYLGQTYYFSGNNREALIEFLLVQSHYPEEAKEWINAALAAMIHGKRTGQDGLY